jgi:ParB-like chromosome segregation protein Spo0J
MKKWETPFADLLPALAPEDFEALKQSIESDGVRVPIVVDELGNIIDGHNRYAIDPSAPFEVRTFQHDLERRAEALRSNLDRRHLSSAQMKVASAARKSLAKELWAGVDGLKWTQEQIAKLLGVPRPTVADWTGDMTFDGAVKSHVDPHLRRGEARVEYVRDRRNEGATQQEVADEMRVDQSTISKIEKKLRRKEAEEAARAEIAEQLAAGIAPAVDLRLGDYRETLVDVECHAVICDPPYGARTHAGGTTRNDGASAEGLAPKYAGWGEHEISEFVGFWAERCSGWIVTLTDSDLHVVWREAFDSAGWLSFQAVPCVIWGMSCRMGGDGPSSAAVYATVARPRTAAMKAWGTLPGAYVGKKQGGAGGGRGKPSWLMEALVGDYSRPGDLVCDPLAGWGSTLAAAQALGRRSVGSEIDPEVRLEALRRLGQ